MKRSGQLSRRSPMARGRGVKPVNRERKAERHARNFGAEAEHVCHLPCIITGDTYPGASIVPAHVESVGAGGGRFDIVPMRWDLHEEQHRIGIDTFAAKYGLDLRRLADDVALGMLDPLGIRGLAQRFNARCPYCRNHPGRDIRDGTVSACPDCDGLARVSCGSQAYADGVAAELIQPLDDYERIALFGWVSRRAERVWAEQPEAIGESAVLAVLVTELGLTVDAAGDLLDAATEGRP